MCARRVLLAAVPAALPACGGEVVVLGDDAPAIAFLRDGEPVERGAGLPVSGINSREADENPTLTGDLLEVFFTSRREPGLGRGDIWAASRSSRQLAFGEPELVRASSEFLETSPAISPDGLTLWFGSDRPGAMGGEGDLDIWRVERASRQHDWGEPRLEVTLNSTERDIPRSPTPGGWMPLASERSGASGGYQTYLARRLEGGDFSEPELLAELVVEGRSMVDGALSIDGRLLFFSRSAPEEPADLYLAWRFQPRGSFVGELALSALNTRSGERDPWLSPDGALLFFSTDRLGEEDIFAVPVRLPTF